MSKVTNLVSLYRTVGNSTNWNEPQCTKEAINEARDMNTLRLSLWNYSDLTEIKYMG